jgi:hypothetical protein
METAQTHCYATDTVTLLWKRHQRPNMSHCPLLKTARPEQPPVRRQSVHMSHYHLRSKVALDLVDRVVDPGDVW